MGSTPRTRVVVAVAVLRYGRVLAARRTRPAETAGRWELPGGKVEPGERPEVAAAREIDEELGCTVRVGSPLAPEQRLRPDLVLRVHRAELVSGEPIPRPGEHDALRWLGPEELDEVPWLDADRAFLSALRAAMLDGDEFTDGNVGGATRIGMTVRRPTGPWSEPVHDLLAFLRAAGLDGIPAVLGADERGREVLSYLPGQGIRVDEETVPDSVLLGAARWLRRFHDTAAGYRPHGTLPWRNGARELGPGEIICHHDPGAYNWVVDESGGRFAGLLDWDMAGPGRPVEDVAFMAWSAVPLHRPSTDRDVARRLRLVADGYASEAIDALAILAVVDARMTAATDRIAAGQRRGDPGMLNLAAVGEPERTRGRLRDLRDRIPSIESSLDH